jgi:hypothetical protein
MKLSIGSAKRLPVAAVTIASAAAVAAVGFAGPANASAPTPVSAHAASATSPLSNIGVSQNSAVNATQTTYPLVLHWTNSGSRDSTYIWRYDDSTGTYTYIGNAVSAVTQWFDVLPTPGGPSAFGDYYQYLLESYDSNGNVLADDWTYEFEPTAYDDSSSYISYSHGTWQRKNQSGATLGHYTYSSSSGATATWSSCFYNVGLVGTTGPAGGTANVIENGVIVKKVNFKSGATKKRVLLWKTGFPNYQCATIQVVRTSGQINIDSFQAYNA